MSNRLSGNSSLAYIGTNAANPPNIFNNKKRAPNAYDYKNFRLGDIWVYNDTTTGIKTIYMLVSMKNNLSKWLKFSQGLTILEDLQGNIGGPVFATNGTINIVGDGVTLNVVGNPGTSTLTASSMVLPGTDSFITDAGTAVPLAGVTHMTGGLNINTAGSTNVVTVNLNNTITGLNSVTTDNLTVNNSVTINAASAITVQNLTVTGSETFSNLGQGVVQSSASGVLSSSKGTDGQVLIASSTVAPAWANITAGSNISIINTSNGIMVSQASTGGSVLIGSGTTSYTNIPSTYKTLVLTGSIFVVPGLPTASFQSVYVTLSSDNGSTYYTGYTSGMNLVNAHVGTTTNVTSVNGLQVGVTYNTNNGAGNVIGFALHLYNVNDGVKPVMASCLSSVGVNTTVNYQCSTGGICNSALTGRINALQLNFASNPAFVYSISTALYGLL